MPIDIIQDAGGPVHQVRTILLLALATTLWTVAAVAEGPAVSLHRAADGSRGHVELALDAAMGDAWDEVNIGRLVVRSATGARSVEARSLVSSRRLPLDLTEEVDTGGCALVLANVGPAWEKDRPDAWQRVSQASKIVVCGEARGADGRQARLAAGVMVMAKAGGRAEIQPLANPALLRPGIDLPVRAYCEGDARAGLEVVARTPEGRRWTGTTDRVGAVVVPIEAAGPWHVEVRCPGDDPASGGIGASLAFEVMPSAFWTADAAKAVQR